jgi:hypothetical protein
VSGATNFHPESERMTRPTASGGTFREIYAGSWYSELDSRQPNLNLVSKWIRMTLTLPIDEYHPASAR